jgi:hypothetical protein
VKPRKSKVAGPFPPLCAAGGHRNLDFPEAVCAPYPPERERFGIREEVTGRKRGRVFSYRRYLAILSEGTDPLLVAV